MIALKICKKIKNKLEDEKIINGYVHSVFQHTCNILTKDQELITILSHEKFMGPMSILINKEEDFTKKHIVQGMEVCIDEKTLVFVGNFLKMDLSVAKVWDGSPQFDYIKDQEENMKEKLKWMEDYIYKHGNLEGIGGILFCLGDEMERLKPFSEREIVLNEYIKFIQERFVKFLKLCIIRDQKNISEGAKKIIGFGPGMTPSTDDFILGLMTAFIYWTDYLKEDLAKIYAFHEEMLKGIGGKTTFVSEKMLKFGTDGMVTEIIKNFMISLLSNKNPKELQNHIENVLKLGNTSGTDMLCGIYIGSRIMFDEKMKGDFS